MAQPNEEPVAIFRTLLSNIESEIERFRMREIPANLRPPNLQRGRGRLYEMWYSAEALQISATLGVRPSEGPIAPTHMPLR